MNNQPDNRYEGGCLCGTVRYLVTTRPQDFLGCHCTQCRKTSGHFVVATRCPNSDLHITDDDGALTWYPSSPQARRGFCRVCGSSLFWKHLEGDHTSIMAGSFDKPTGLHICQHIYTATSGDYYDLDDSVPHHADRPRS